VEHRQQVVIVTSVRANVKTFAVSAEGAYMMALESVNVSFVVTATILSDETYFNEIVFLWATNGSKGLSSLHSGLS
jgi:hypothetical protein